jgi:hypothetical protein
MKTQRLCGPLLLVTWALLGCDGQQYVSPDTVLFSVTGDKTGSKLVSQCSYVPVLLGAQVDGHYTVDGALQASITITRDYVTVRFERASEDFEPFRFATKELETGAVSDPLAPAGYTVELTPGCTPEEP